MSEAKLDNNRIIDLMETISELKGELNVVNDQLKKEKEKVSELQEYNNKLFLKITNKVEEKTDEIPVSNLVDEELWNLLDDKQKQFLHEVGEGNIYI